ARPGSGRPARVLAQRTRGGGDHGRSADHGLGVGAGRRPPTVRVVPARGGHERDPPRGRDPVRGHRDPGPAHRGGRRGRADRRRGRGRESAHVRQRAARPAGPRRPGGWDTHRGGRAPGRGASRDEAGGAPVSDGPVSGAPIRLLLADDQALVRGALAALLEMEGDLEVAAQLADGTEVAETVARERVDVALLDIEMPGLDGIEAARAIAAGGTGCRSLIVTTFGRPGYLRRALEAGASGFVVKDTPAEQLAEAVRAVHAGQRVVDPSLAAETLVSGMNPLTDRERDVLRAALDGSSV